MKRYTIVGGIAVVAVAMAVLMWPRERGTGSGAERGAAAHRAASSGDVPSEIPDIPRIRRPELSATGLSGVANPEELSGARVFGRVVMQGTDSPIVAARVELLPGAKTGEAASATTTNGNGEFEFWGVEPGPPRFVVASGKNLAIPKLLLDSDRVMIPVRANEVGPILIELAVSPALRLRIVSETNGAPLAGATVEMMTPIERMETASSSGELELSLPAGGHQLRIRAPAHATKRQMVNISEDMSLEVALAPGGTVFGTVASDKGEPLEGVSIIANLYEFDSYKAVTDGDGQYRIENLPLKIDMRFDAQLPGTPGVDRGTEHVSLTKEQPEQRIDFMIAISDRIPNVERLAIAGLVKDSRGEPIAGAGIIVQSSGIAQPSHYTDANGRFVIDNFYRRQREILGVSAHGFQTRGVEVAPGPAASPAEVTVTLPDALWVKGQVVDAEDQPVAEIRVIPIRQGAARREQMQTTLKDGRFAFDSLEDGVTFNIEGEDIAPMSSVNLKFNSDDNLIKLGPPTAILGKVVDASTNEPIPEFKVHLKDLLRAPGNSLVHMQGQRETVQVASDRGEFTFRGIDPKLPIDLLFEAEGYSPAAVDRVYARPESQAKPLTVKMRKGSLAVQGVIVSSDMTRIAGADVAALIYATADRQRVNFRWSLAGPTTYEANPLDTVRVTSNAEGVFLLEKLHEDLAIDIVVRAQGYAPVRVPNVESMSEDDRLSLLIKMPKSGRIFGRVDQEKIPGASRVTIASVDSEPSRGDHGISSGYGGFEFAGLAPGNYRLTLRGSTTPGADGSYNTGILTSKDVELSEGKELEVYFDDANLHRIAGRILIGNLPLARGLVALFSNEGLMIGNTESDETGAFEIPQVQGGEYQFVAAERDDSGIGTSHLTLAMSPHWLPISIEADIERDFVFPAIGSVTGRIVHLPEGEFRLYLQANFQPANGRRLDRSSRVDTDGSFEFKNVFGGEYKLLMLAGQQNRIVRPSVLKSTDTENLNLGDLSLGDGGAIRVSIQGDVPESLDPVRGLFTVMAAIGNSPIVGHTSIVSSVGVQDSGGDALIEHLPAGFYVLWMHGPGYMSVPRYQIVDVGVGQTVEIAFAVEPVTSISLRGATDKKIVSVRAKPESGGNTIILRERHASEPLDLSAIQASYMLLKNPTSKNEIWIGAMGLPPGGWEIIIELSDGRTWSGRYELRPGERVDENIAIPGQ